jgi:hypothetical protein
MAFNAHTYRMNQYRKEAWAYLAEARAIKAAVAAGDSFAIRFNADRIPSRVFLARNSMRLFRSQRTLRNLSRRTT